MKIAVTVKPNAAATQITRVGTNEYSIRLHAPAREGKANTELIAVLSDYFSRPKSCVKLVHGLGSRKKIVEIQ